MMVRQSIFSSVGNCMTKSVCVFTGSSFGKAPEYEDAARRMGQAIAEGGLTLVYGGASVGLMGVVADAALAAGGRVIGVLPKALADLELAHSGLTELHLVGSMHERKTIMADLADMFVALPGGLGTFEEIFEVWTWSQLGVHAKPVGFLDVRDYYQLLFRFLDHAVDQGFLKPSQRDFAIRADDPGSLLDQLLGKQVVYEPKWIGRAER